NLIVPVMNNNLIVSVMNLNLIVFVMTDEREVNHTRNEFELNRDHEGDRDCEGEHNGAEGNRAKGDCTPATVDHRLLVLKPLIDKNETYLMTKIFNYIIIVLNDKINLLYKLCKYIGDQQ